MANIQFDEKTLRAVAEDVMRGIMQPATGQPNGPAKPAAPLPMSTTKPAAFPRTAAHHGPRFGVFEDAKEACAAAQDAFLQLKENEKFHVLRSVVLPRSEGRRVVVRSTFLPVQLLDERPVGGTIRYGAHAAPQLPGRRADGHLLATAVLRVNSHRRFPTRRDSETVRQGPL